MPTQTVKSRPVHDGPGDTARVPYAEIMAAARRAPTAQAFLTQALRLIAEYFKSPFGLLYVRSRSEVFEEQTHSGPTDPGFWRPAVQRFLTEALSEGVPCARVMSARKAQLKVSLLAAPLANHEAGLSGAIAVVVQGGAAEARLHLQTMQALAALTGSSVGLVGRSGKSEAGDNLTANRSLARAATAETPEELAFSLTNGLRTKLGCEQVALGMVFGKRVRVVSISGLDEVKDRNPGVARLRGAMEECLDLGQTVVSQPGEWQASEDLVFNCALHERWRQSAGGACVASIPLFSGQRCAAILSLRRRSEEPFTPEQLAEIRKVVEPFASGLILLHKARRGLVRHVVESVKGAAHTLFGPGYVGRKVAAGLLVAASLWFCFGTLDYQLTVPARILPAIERHVAAPFDARLAEVAVAEGDVVSRGDLLCRFDTRDLELQKDELTARIGVLEREQMRAQAKGDPVEASLVGAKLHLARTQLAIMQQRIAQATLTAPFDGVVIKGDLRKQVGSVLAQGTPLFEIAPLETWKIEMEVPENVTDELAAQIASVGAANIAGSFAGSARPEVVQRFTLQRLRPAAEVRDGRNVYIAEATIRPDADWMRPGMEGTARVDLGRRKVWWVALHRILDYLRINYWL